MDEQIKKDIIKKAGTFKIVSAILTDSKAVKANDKVEVPWTLKQTLQYEQNQ